MQLAECTKSSEYCSIITGQLITAQTKKNLLEITKQIIMRLTYLELLLSNSLPHLM